MSNKLNCMQHNKTCPVLPTGAVLGWQNISSKQPPAQYGRRQFCRLPRQWERAARLMEQPFVVAAATSMGEGCAINGTAVTAVLIDQ